MNMLHTDITTLRLQPSQSLKRNNRRASNRSNLSTSQSSPSTAHAVAQLPLPPFSPTINPTSPLRAHDDATMHADRLRGRLGSSAFESSSVSDIAHHSTHQSEPRSSTLQQQVAAVPCHFRLPYRSKRPLSKPELVQIALQLLNFLESSDISSPGSRFQSEIAHARQELQSFGLVDRQDGRYLSVSECPM